MRRWVLLLLGPWLIAGCSDVRSTDRPLPALLQDATAAGGIDQLCRDPKTPLGAPGTTPETAGRSPEIHARLQRDFPPGTSVAKLEAALKGWGFEIMRCEHDPLIAHARFDQFAISTTQFLGFEVARFQSHASGTITWKADTQGRIVWTTGTISYGGL